MSIQHSSSEIRKVSYELKDILYKLVRPKTKPIYQPLLDWLIHKHGKKIIEEKTDAELKSDLEPAYYLLKPIFDKFDMGYSIQEGRKLGSPEPPSLGDIKKAMEQLRGVI